jgi:Fur family ferric uptake transcriptional regulator
MHHARDTLRRSGYRLTPQRTAVWEALREHSGRHLTAEDIVAIVHRRLPDVNLSTVYRTLELLVALELVTETKLGSSTSRFEVSPDPQHHHLVCERCGSVGHFGDDLLGPLYRRLAEGHGFTPARAHATVFGLCRACSGSQDEAGGGGRAHP